MCQNGIFHGRIDILIVVSIPSQNDLPAPGTSVNSRPPTRNSFIFPPHSGQNISDFIDPTVDDTMDGSVTSSPTSSSSQCEGRDHEFYRRGIDPVDGLYHCPMEAEGKCDFPPKVLKCEYQ